MKASTEIAHTLSIGKRHDCENPAGPTAATAPFLTTDICKRARGDPQKISIRGTRLREQQHKGPSRATTTMIAKIKLGNVFMFTYAALRLEQVQPDSKQRLWN